MLTSAPCHRDVPPRVVVVAPLVLHLLAKQLIGAQAPVDLRPSRPHLTLLTSNRTT